MAKQPTEIVAEKPKRGKRVDVTLTYADGSTGKTVRADAVSIEFDFLGTEQKRVIDLTKIPESSRLCAFVFGVRQKGQNTYANAKEEGIETKLEQFDTVVELLMAGNWVQEGEKTGPRLTVILEAVVAAKLNAGLEMGDDAVADLREKLKDKTFRDGVKANLDVKAEMERISSERSAARAKKAKDKAKGSDLDALAAI